MACPGDPANSVYVSLGLNANVGSRPGPAGCADTYQANYESIQDWHNARARNLVTADETEILECYHDWPSGLSAESFQMTGWTGDDSHEVVIRAAQGQGPTKVPEDGFHLVGVVRGLYLTSNYIRVKGIGVVASFEQTIQINAQRCRIEGCFLRQNNDGYACVFLASHYNHIFNNFMFDGGWGINTGSVVYAQNNTIRNALTGLYSARADALAIIKNNVVFASRTADYSVHPNNQKAGNVASDASEASVVYTITDPNAEFVGADGSDLHILETAGFRGLGEDRSGADPNTNFNTDIDGDTRTVPWDCGADEFVSVLPPTAKNAIFHGANF